MFLRMSHKEKIHRIFGKKNIIQLSDNQNIYHKNQTYQKWPFKYMKIKTVWGCFFIIYVLLRNEWPMLFIRHTKFLYLNPLQHTIVCFQDLLWENFTLNKLFSIIRFHQYQRPILLDILLLI
jgi:hypothetical protein